jgi:hypothetical protein
MINENKAAKTLAIVVGGFIVSWTPFFVMYVLEAVLAKGSITKRMSDAITWLGYFNSMINPIIYAYCSKQFRSAFYRITIGRCKAKRHLAGNTFNNFNPNYQNNQNSQFNNYYRHTNYYYNDKRFSQHRLYYTNSVIYNNNNNIANNTSISANNGRSSQIRMLQQRSPNITLNAQSPTLNNNIAEEATTLHNS